MAIKHLAGAVGALGSIALLFAAPALADPEPPVDPGTVNAAAAPEEGVPHLSSPDNLPPGTSNTPAQQSSAGGTYLRELWHAYKTQEVTGSELLLLLSQRPMSNGAPPPISSMAPPAAPVEGAPVAPVEGAPVAPVEGAPVAPVEGAPVAPVEGAPAAPVEGAPADVAPVAPAGPELPASQPVPAPAG
ncbi:hypothetical protein [Mycolicibacterium brumae]|uniref:hypothetical protein n=1 Tax=Mycolicibacterium brumae TaxID=85968 RepID=UPI000A579FE8|nr:hypothetical protein [Mycolicibacterium brumae]MCV7192828.1 hypothetical protein [Mycolicibacterium brumae]RWA23416.1 hypothetical protein MBRU_00935 [Mycolicibacterium brumae DSM 44177]UWW08652.1 hypothetical protein L2Z93_001715 [Mycolicibacterium brumae]